MLKGCRLPECTKCIECSLWQVQKGAARAVIAAGTAAAQATAKATATSAAATSATAAASAVAATL